MQVNKIGTYAGHSDAIYTLEHNGGKNTFLSAGGDGKIIEWSLEHPDAGKLIADVGASVYAMHYTNDDLLIVGVNNSGISIVDLKSGKEAEFKKFTDKVIFDIQLINDWLYIGCADGEFYKVNYPNLNIIQELRLGEKNLRSIAYDEVNGNILTGSSDQTIKVVSEKDFKQTEELKGFEGAVFDIKISSNIIYASGKDAHVKMWEIKKGSYKRHNYIKAHMYTINDLTFLFEEQQFATCSMDKSIKIWDTSTNKLIKVLDNVRFPSHGTSINKLLWLDEANVLVSASDDKKIGVWEVKK